MPKQTKSSKFNSSYHLGDKNFMNYLIQGQECHEKIDIIIKHARLESENMIAAIIDHYCFNMTKTEAALMNDVKLPNLSRDIKKVNVVAGDIERIKELDWSDYQELKANKKAA